MPPSPLQNPARFVPPFAVSFANASGESDVVSAANPLPVSTIASAAPASLSGTATSSETVGPFLPIAGRPVMLTLSGTWSGSVSIRRSADGGTTKLPITALGKPYGTYSANICEPVWEEGEAGIQLYLAVTLASGTVSYRMGQ